MFEFIATNYILFEIVRECHRREGVLIGISDSPEFIITLWFLIYQKTVHNLVSLIPKLHGFSVTQHIVPTRTCRLRYLNSN